MPLHEFSGYNVIVGATLAVAQVGSLELITYKYEESDKKDKCTVARFLIYDQYRFKGYGTAALKLVKEYAFNELNLKKITLGIFDFNESALKCYIKAGFIEAERVVIEGWNRIGMEIINTVK